MSIRLSAKPVVEKIHSDLLKRVETFKTRYGRSPKLSVVLVGNDPASIVYTRKKGETAVALGMDHETLHLPSSSCPEEVLKTITRLNDDPTVDGILVQRPLPVQFKESEVLFWIDPSKDVDAFHPTNAGKLVLGLPCFKPCTPSGVMALLKHYGIELAGQVACVVGRSSIVGKPMAALLLQENATILQCHSKTRNLPSFTQQADILVVAAGKPGLINASHVRPGTIVIDVGIHRNAEGKLVGDVDFDSVAEIAGAITPVPGGVGPMTIAVLMENTVWAAEQRGQ